MGSNLVVLTPPVFDDDLRIDSVSEPLHRQAFIAELAVERFVRAVLPRLAGFNVCGVDVGLCEPLQYGPRDELRAVVGAYMTRVAMHADQSAQHFDDPPGANTASHIDGQAFSREFIDYG